MKQSLSMNSVKILPVVCSLLTLALLREVVFSCLEMASYTFLKKAALLLQNRMRLELLRARV